MDTPGTRNIGLGLLWFVGGSLVTMITYGAAGGGGHYVVAYGAILAGAVQFFVGLFQYGSFAAQSPMDRLLPRATPELKALLRTMIASAEDDGPLNDRKIQLVQAILQKVTGKDEFTSFRLRDISQAMAQDGTTTSKYLATVQSNFTLEIKQLILRTGTLLVANGTDNAARAQTFLREIGQALQLTDQQCADATGGMVQYSVAPATQSA